MQPPVITTFIKLQLNWQSINYIVVSPTARNHFKPHSYVLHHSSSGLKDKLTEELQEAMLGVSLVVLYCDGPEGC